MPTKPFATNEPDAPRLDPAPRSRDQEGQATAEYALLTGAVALILALVAAWATSTGRVTALLNAVFDSLIAAV